MKPQCDMLYNKLVAFVTKILGMAQNKAEIGAILDEKHAIRTTEESFQSNLTKIPKRLELALHLEFKQVSVSQKLTLARSTNN